MNTFPNDWTVDRLKDVSLINTTTLGAGTDPLFEFPYLEISNVDYFGIVDVDVIERLLFENAPSRARRVVPKNATIISSVRPNLQAAAFFPVETNGLICSTGFNVVEPKIYRLCPRYLYYVLISEYARQYFESVATGVGYPAVADKYFGALEIPLPPISEQERIAAFLEKTVRQVDRASMGSAVRNSDKDPRQRGLLHQQMATLTAYRKSLIHECVTGKRRISDADIAKVEAHV
jgi:type I restriction enzyme S subunit